MLLSHSNWLERILRRLSDAVLFAINNGKLQCKFIPYMLRDLAKLDTRPACLTEIAYEWCSLICENHQNLKNPESVLLVSLEVGFRHLDFQSRYINPILTHTEHHRKLVDVVFKSQDNEVIADLLHAWTAESGLHSPARTLLGLCAEHLVSLHNLVPFSSKLRRLVIRSIELIGHSGFEGVGVDGFVGLLNHLRVAPEDMDKRTHWGGILLDTIETPEGAQHLSCWYWELLVEFALQLSRTLHDGLVYNPRTIALLIETQEWSKLECWVGAVWMVWPPEAGATTEEELGHSMQLLFHQRPGAVRKLEEWMEQWSEKTNGDIPESFHRICRQAQETARRGEP